MNNRNKHIKQSTKRTLRSFLKTSIILGCTLMFISINNLQAQVINNNGATISVTNGVVVNSDTLENSVGLLTNDGTINLSASYRNAGTTSGNGIYNIAGNWTNIGVFNPGTSTVHFNGSNIQTITSTGGEIFNNLIINNSGASPINRIILSNNVTISGTLTFSLGNVETGANKLFLSNQSIASLNYTSVTGSRVIGQFERGINTTGNYLFPVGSDADYNPLNLNPNVAPAPGSVLSEYIATDPGDAGLPLPDAGFLNAADSVEIFPAYDDGYWSLTSIAGFSSLDYNINLNGSGFLIDVTKITRIIKRPAGGDWILDGTHSDAIDTVAYRNNLTGNILGTGNHYGFGHGRPRIQIQPQDTAVCDGESASFSVTVSGRPNYTLQWQENQGSGWNDITNGGIYSGATTSTLSLSATNLTMNLYEYRVIITHDHGNHNNKISDPALLTVNPRPVALATPQQDTICNGSTTHIELTSDVPGTTFVLEILNPTTTITGASLLLDGDTIKQTLTNPTYFADSVVYRIVPYGPFSTNCEGTADTVIIWVEPTVEINAVNDTICNGDATNILVTSPNTTTNGIRYTWTVADNPNITGESGSIGNGQNIATAIVQNLSNNSLTEQLVQYVITPWTVNASNNNECTDAGEVITIDIWVEPTVQINAVNDTICDGDDTNLMVTSPNSTTNGIRYTWTVTDNPNITGESNSTGNGQSIGTAIIQTLDNISDNKQLVQYVITPWTINANNDNECTDAGEIIIVDIWVEPTPIVITTVFKDTICNDTRTHITLTTPTILTTGVVTFNYTSSADAGLTGNTSGITGLTDSNIIEDSLHNATALPAIPQVVRYSITPVALSTGCANGPVVTDSITVHPTPDTYFINVDSVRCYLDSNGRATIVAENGINIFTYEWNDPLNQTTDQATGLSRGTYKVTVTDNQGCIKEDSVDIEEPFRIIPVIDSTRNVSCYGNGDGYVSVAPTGGNSQYSYIWNISETTSYIDGLSGGIFSVTVTDHKGCSQDTLVEIIEPEWIILTFDKGNVVCNGEANGWAEVTTPAESYMWDTGDTTALITGRSSRRYYVTIVDAGSCIATGDIEIEEPDEPLTSSNVSTKIWCAGDANGTIDITVEGGNDYTDYTYSWSTSDGSGLIPTNEDQSGLSGGNYYVTVTDDRECEVLDSSIVGEPPTFSSDIDCDSVTCFGDDNGWISLDVTGGNGSDYTYTWNSESGSTYADTAYLDNLLADQYYVTITDSLYCEIYGTAIITEPDTLETFISKTNVTCYNYDNGTAKITILGGNGGYIIDWSNGATLDSIFDLSAGIYQVTVSDSKGCISTNSANINEPDRIQNNMTTENISCYGFGNGRIVLNPTGGTTPYNYTWSHNAFLTDNLVENLMPGNYSISVLDDNNCLRVSNTDLTQPDPLEVTVMKNDITCYGMDDGYISLSMFGGTPEYTYNWSAGFMESSADMLTGGLYEIVITDIHDCEIDTTVEIIEPEKLVISPVIKRPTCTDIRDGYIELNLSGGIEPYYIYWDNGSSDENLYDIRSGIFDLLINDNNLCEIDTSFIIRSAHDFCFEIPSAFSPNGDYINDTWEMDLQELYPSAEIEIFDRWGKRVFFSKGYEESQYWDGKYNGRDLPMDSYFYIIYLRNGTGRISGTVTLLR
ncbi:MAG: gliding motility-associated C-terminal domain-containing protein [Bacteroidales bacterium]|nr:gliding motility-associated C-terminal domain-containing protein [Bacteroidales bacterium]